MWTFIQFYCQQEGHVSESQCGIQERLLYQHFCEHVTHSNQMWD